MGMDFHGWVEITQWDEREQDDPHAWGGVIQLGHLIDRCDEITWFLFGFKKWVPTGWPSPLAPSRGLPANPSKEVLRDLKWIEEHAAPGEVAGYPVGGD